MTGPAPSALAIAQARRIVANPADYLHLPLPERQRLFGRAWAMLKASRHPTPAQPKDAA
jgi:hypothetical protein